MIELDGAQGEGGGQILRSSLTLALMTGKPFRLRNLRAGRSKPGLQPQHLMSVRAAATIGQAKLRGAALGSQDLVFEPGPVTPGDYHFAIGTAGATALVLHTVYLPLALASEPSTVAIEGGTHVKAAPCFHFLDRTWRSYLALIGIDVALAMGRPGFYPRGGGRIEARIAPCHVVRGLTIDAIEPIQSAGGVSAVAGLPRQIAQRQANRVRHKLHAFGVKAELNEETWPGGPGTVVAIELPTTPAPTLFFALGERGKPAEQVADEAVEQARDFLEATPRGIDEHSADQLLLPLAFAAGASHFPVAAVSSHLLTNAEVVRRFCDCELAIDGKLGKPGMVRIQGVGHRGTHATPPE